jgi:protein-L-isoaspartate(D-aspartate) O-methyltransferase
LEVGTGTGYQAAVLAHLGARVYTIERNPKLAERARARLHRLGYSVEVITGDGCEGYSEAAPYDAVLVTAASPAIPRALIDQLANGGRLVAPIGSRHEQELRLVTKMGDNTFARPLTSVQFVPLIGKEGWSDTGQWPVL